MTLRIAALLRTRVRHDHAQSMRDHASGHRQHWAERLHADVQELGALVEAGLGPRVLADTVNDSIDLLLETFPAGLVLAPPMVSLPNTPQHPTAGPGTSDPDPSDPAPGETLRVDLLGDERAAAAALLELARTRAVADHARKMLHTHTHADPDRCPACLALDATDTTDDDPDGEYGDSQSTLADEPDEGGVLTDLDVAVVLGRRGVRQGNLRDVRWITFQHTVLGIVLQMHRNRVADLYRRTDWHRTW